MLKFLLAALLATGIAPTQSPTEIARSIAELGSANFRTREAASEKLRNFGAPALQPLQDSLNAGNPEANRRAEVFVREKPVAGASG